MGILARLERRFTSYHPSDPGSAVVLGGSAIAASGQLVTPDNALGLMAVYRAVRLLSQTLAKLPLRVYEVKPDESLAPALAHPLSALLTVRPNKWQTPFEFKEMLAGHLELRGNAYAEIFSDGRGRPRELVPLHPDRVYPRRGVVTPEGPEIIWYEYWPVIGPMRVLFPDDVLHIRGFSIDGLVGISPVAVAREMLGLAMAAEEYAGRFFGNDSQPGGVLTTPKPMDEDARKRLKKSWEAAHSGARNKHRVAVLEDGLTWTTIGVTNKDSQFLESRKFSVVEIARMFDLPPHKLMEMESSTDNNIEHQGIEFQTDTISPRAVRWHEAIQRDCLLPSDEGRFVARFDLDELSRGDSAARSTYYREMWGIGALSTNDIRRKENMGPVDGGDERFVPLNMVPLAKAGELPTPAPATDPAALPPPGGKQLPAVADAQARALRARIAVVHRRLFVEAITRILKREAGAARKAVQEAVRQQSTAPFDGWVDAFYPEHEAFALRAIQPAVETAGDAIAAAAAVEVGTDPESLLPTASGGPGLRQLLVNAAAVAARAHVVTSRAELRQAVQESTSATRAAAIEACVARWESSRADRAAQIEVDAVVAAVVGYVYRTAGLTPPDLPSRSSSNANA